ncbi:hypothetical protein [Pseudomonas sp. UBA6562]|uniref:hypothetical protein n=1 Tax=Pseudomonas sp. UBA6562 TaxID=1947332 RepID=UPI0025D5983D|nr:hypothetical protein [Pseudomonas sp. UBA6562]
MNSWIAGGLIRRRVVLLQMHFDFMLLQRRGSSETTDKRHSVALWLVGKIVSVREKYETIGGLLMIDAAIQGF